MSALPPGRVTVGAGSRARPPLGRYHRLGSDVDLPTQSADTSEAAERFLYAAYARMSPAEKGRIIFDLIRFGDEAALVEIRRRHPGCTDHEARMRLAARKYPRELLIAAFGWDPEVEGP